MSSISSGVSDISSLDEVESEFSYDDEAKVSPAPRRYSHEAAAAFTTQTQTMVSTPRRVSAPLSAPRIRSNAPPPTPRLRRPVTASAPATVAPESSDRLKHLKIHMKQLKRLYNEEVHLEQLAARDAFLQTMCTSSITLFRHCASRSRFFTAVKALMCQYLPASSAKLIQVERSGSSSTSKPFLVLQDNQTFEVTESDSAGTGIAGNAAHAMTMSLNSDGRIPPDFSRSSSSNSSFSVSVARTSDEPTYSSVWLESFADCILPSTSGHLLLLSPIHSLYRLGFHQEIDLAVRKKDTDGAQLLVMGLKNSKGYPIGIVEAIVPNGSQCNVEFLDAFGVLLATALESRMAFCRSVTDTLSIQIVDDEPSGIDPGEPRTDDAASGLQPALAVPLLEKCGRIDLFGGAAVLPEQDEALLRSFQKPITRICKENRDLRQQAREFEHLLVGLGQLWGNLSADSFETDLRNSGCEEWQPVRAYFADFLDQLIADNRSNTTEDSISSAQIRLLFRGETKKIFKRAYGGVSDVEFDDSASGLFSGADGQFAILQQVMDSNEAFESGGAMLVLPICDGGLQQRNGHTEGASRPPSQANAAMIVVLPEANSSDETKSSFATMMKLHVAPLLVQFAEHLLFKLRQIDHTLALQQRLEAMSEQEVALTTQITDGMILKGITHQYLMCSSLEELVMCVNSLAISNEDLKSAFTQATLFIASYSGAKESSSRNPLASVWTMAEDVNPGICEKIELAGEPNAGELRGSGISGYVLFTQEALSYNSEHHAFAPSWQDQQPPSSRFEHNCFYAVPLTTSASAPIGVLEFAFESESQRERFLEDPRLLHTMSEVTSQFISLHQQFIGREDRIHQEVEDAKDLHNQVLQRWVSFVATWLALPVGDFDTWKHDVSVLLLELLPSRGYFVNLLCSIRNQTDEENAAVQTILSDVSHPPHSSNTLNVLNRAILSTCVAFPLERGYASGDISAVYGVLAFSRKDDKLFTSEEKQLGAMASYLLSNQVMLFRQRDEFESAVRNYKEQLANQIETIARISDSNNDLLRDLLEKQSLVRLSSVRYDELVPSMSIEQLCEKAIQSISRPGGTTSESSGQASQAEARSVMSVLVFDASNECFTLVGNGCQRISVPVSGNEASDEPWFSKHHISAHDAPFAKVPSKLIKALASCRPNEQMDSITIVPVRDCDESEEQELFGLTVLTSGKGSTDDYLLDVAECFRKVFRLKRDSDNRNIKQQHLKGIVSALRTEQQASNLWNALFSLAHELWSEIIGVLSSFGDAEACKHQLKSRLAGSLTRILRDHVDLNRVELTLGKKQSETISSADLPTPLHATESTFVRELVVMGKEEVFLGILCVVWKPEDSTLRQEDLLALLEWTGVFLQNLLHYCFVSETIQARAKDAEAQHKSLEVREHNHSKTIERMEEQELRWHLVRQVTSACASIMHSGSDIDSDALDADSPWYRLFAAIHSFRGPQFKLWLIDETSTVLWSILDGKRETKAFPVQKENASAGAPDHFSIVELVHDQAFQGSKMASRVVLGILEIFKTDQPPNYEQNPSADEMVVQQLVIVLSHTLRLVKQTNEKCHLEDNLRHLELKAAARTEEWRRHVNTRFKQLLAIQSRTSKFVSSKLSSKPGSKVLEIWLRGLLEVVENSFQREGKLSHSGEAVSNGPSILRLRSFLLFESESRKTERCMPPLLHSCRMDCGMCFTSTIMKNIQELELIMEEKGEKSCLALGLRETEVQSTAARHPALELLLSKCQNDEKERQSQSVWELGKHDVVTSATHQLLVKTVRRDIPNIGVVRVVLIGVVERSTEIDDASSSLMFSFCGETVLDAVRQLVHATAQYEKEGDLGGELLKAERELGELTQKQGILGNAMEDIGSIFLSTVGSESSDLGLKVVLGRIFQRITGMPVKAHLCARLEISDLADEWMVIGSKNERQATQELLQCVKTIAAKTSKLDYNMNKDTVGIKAKRDDSGGRLVYLLLDAKDAIIGALVLDSSANPIAQIQGEFASTIKSVLQVAGAKVGSVRNKLKHDTQLQRMSQERDRLLLDKCQLELNSLEMKNLLHNNEANLLKLRSHYEQVVRPTNESVRTFLYEFKDLTSPNEVLLQLGHAITSLKDVTGVHFAMLHEKTQKDPSTLFSSIAKDDNKRIVRSTDVQDAMRRCVKQGEMIKLCVKNQSKDMQSEEASNCSQSAKCAMLYPMTILQDVHAQTKTECRRVDVAEPNPTANIVVIVLAVAPISANSVPFPAEGDPLMYQLEQVELLLRLATMRCHTLVQRDLWKQQLDMLAEKESNTEDHIQLMSLKCDQWQAKHEFQTQLQRGLAHQLALGLPSLHSDAAKAATSKQMMEMWQALLEILRDRLEAAFRSRKAVSRSSVQLYGAVQDGNFFFTFSKSTGAKTRLQLVAFQQCIKSPAHQAIWKVYASEAVAESRWCDDECVNHEAASESVKTMFPVMSITNEEEDQGHEKVVGVLEFRSEQPLDEDEKELVHEFLAWFSPAVYWIRRAVQQKMLQKHASRRGGVSTTTNSHLPPRENVRSATLSISSQSLGLASAALPSARQSREPSNLFAADDARVRSRQDLETENSSNFGAGDKDECESEAALWRKKREQLLPGIVALLLRLQEANDLRALAKTVRHEMKRLWAYHAKRTRQSIHDCQLIHFEGTGAEHQTNARSNNDDMEVAPWASELMKSRYKLRGTTEFEVLQGADPNAPSGSGEQFRLIYLPEISNRGARYCLLITGSYLDDVFDADDERVHLPQIARGVQRQLSQLCKMARLQEEASELQTIKHEEATLVAKASQLERNVADMSGFLEFQLALNGIEDERALSNLVTDYLTKLLRCEHIVFQGVVPGSRTGAEQSLSFTEAHIEEGDSVQFATSTLAMDNLVRLRVFSPHASGAELLAICTARMGTESQPLDVDKQELLKRVSPTIGSAIHRLRVQEKLSRQVYVSDNAKSEIERLSRENRKLHSQLQQQSHCKEDFDARLGDQQALVAENKRLEAQLSKTTARLDAFACEREEQQFELATREKANAKLIFQLDQFAKVEAQIQRIDGENSALRYREKKLEKKVLKQRLQLQQLVSEVGHFKQKEEFDRHEIAQLQRQVAVLNEKQRDTGVMTTKESLLQSQSSRYYRHMQHQAQKRKQINLAQELRQLTAMEVREMKARNRDQRVKSSRQLHTQTQEGDVPSKPSQPKIRLS